MTKMYRYRALLIFSAWACCHFHSDNFSHSFPWLFLLAFSMGVGWCWESPSRLMGQGSLRSLNLGIPSVFAAKLPGCECSQVCVIIPKGHPLFLPCAMKVQINVNNNSISC